MDTMENFKIAILGATSHIAKGLINNFLQNGGNSLYLYSRSSEKVVNFLHTINKSPDENCKIIEGYKNFSEIPYDVIINCVGIGTLNKHQGNYANYFTVVEEYDNLIISYLRSNHPDTLYVSFSSGAIYGKNYSTPMDDKTINNIDVNHVKQEDYYAITRLNAEAKHRAFKDLRIVDLRIFSYFSRFADLTDGYLITEIINCILKKQLFTTNDSDVVRDYIHPDDLFTAILKCVEIGDINMAFDIGSTKPVTKKEIIDYFSKAYDLRYEIDKTFEYKGATGNKNVYYSVYNKAIEIGYQPEFSSLDTIKQESKFILDDV